VEDVIGLLGEGEVRHPIAPRPEVDVDPEAVVAAVGVAPHHRVRSEWRQASGLGEGTVLSACTVINFVVPVGFLGINENGARKKGSQALVEAGHSLHDRDCLGARGHPDALRLPDL
jgi:hypothetical protein